MAKAPKKRGPKEDRLILSGSWEKAIDKALAKKKPPNGWPTVAPRAKPKRSGKQRP